MSNINATITIPGDHPLVGALKGQAAARRALGMLADELLEGLMEDGDAWAREHVLDLAKRAQARYGEAYEEVHRALEFEPGDPRFDVPRRDAVLAKRLAELLAPKDKGEDPGEVP